MSPSPGSSSDRDAVGPPSGSTGGKSWDLLAGRDFTEIRFGGSGGQGVILMGFILATAAALDHRRVVQTESYGPEARGGYSRSDVIISNDAVDYPEVEQADLLVAISQPAAAQYIGSLRQEGIFIYDADNVTKPPVFRGTRFAVPFSRMALEETGRLQTTNILVLGAVAAITGVVSAESLRRAVMGKVPPGTEEINSQALARGLALDPAEWLQGNTGGYPWPAARA